MSILRVGINYVTFKRDIEWLEYSLQSCRKYAKGFCGITIVVPAVDFDAFMPLEAKYSTPDCPVIVRQFLEFPGKGFVHHLAMKCYADVSSSGWTHTLHMDPDCLFTSPITPLDYFVEGKPVLLIEPYEAIHRAGHAGRLNWKSVTETALRFECTHETMCRHPAVHHHWIYKELRRHMEAAHGTPFLDFVLRQKNEFPQGFGEFNTIGAYAFKEFPHSYHWIDREFDGEKNDPPSKVWQGWAGRPGGAGANLEILHKILS